MKRVEIIWTAIFLFMLFSGLWSTFNQYRGSDTVVHSQFHKR